MKVKIALTSGYLDKYLPVDGMEAISLAYTLIFSQVKQNSIPMSTSKIAQITIKNSEVSTTFQIAPNRLYRNFKNRLTIKWNLFMLWSFHCILTPHTALRFVHWNDSLIRLKKKQMVWIKTINILIYFVEMLNLENSLCFRTPTSTFNRECRKMTTFSKWFRTG